MIQPICLCLLLAMAEGGQNAGWSHPGNIAAAATGWHYDVNIAF